MTTDFRALCAELYGIFEKYDDESNLAGIYWDMEKEGNDVLGRARAVLAEPEPEDPTDEELSDLWSWAAGQDQGPWPTQQHCFARAVLARWGNPTPQLPASVAKEPRPTDQQLKTFACEWWHKFGFVKNKATCTWVIDEIAPEHFVDFMRSVLARWGNPAPQHNPWKDTLLDALVCNFLLNAENEDNPKKALNDLIAWEKQLATDPLINPELQPVPISERLPEPKDCDAEGRCWWWHPSHAESGYWEGWMLRPRAWGVGRYDFDDRLVHTHWIPAHAISLPTAND